MSKGLEYLHSKSIVHLDLKVSAAEIFLNFKFNEISAAEIFRNFKFNEIIGLQPENIVLTERGGQTVKIIDFGTAMQLRKGEKVEKAFKT